MRAEEDIRNDEMTCSYVTTGVVGGTIEVDNRDIVSQVE